MLNVTLVIFSSDLFPLTNIEEYHDKASHD
jgi:hypothetical protein